MLKNQVVRALGAMSGTSLDGVDAAEVLTDGHTIHGFGDVAYRAYLDADRGILRDALGKWPDEDVRDAAEVVETAHAQVLSNFVEAQIIGFHGQTLAHDPHNRGTFQIGDGQILAEILQKPVVSDFRSADVELGGQGAPLSPFYHFALAKWIGAVEPIVFLNLGGVGNITWVDPNADHATDVGAILAFDTGPANAPLDDLMNARMGQSLDVDGTLAQSGQVDEEIVAAFLQDPYFYRMPPKSLDRDAFKGLSAAVDALSDANAAATLTAACAMSVSAALELCPTQPNRVLVCGGGRHNATLMAMLDASMNCTVSPVEDVGLNGDMLEAQAFAFLAVRVLNGLPTSCPATTGVRAAVSGGTLSVPNGQVV